MKALIAFIYAGVFFAVTDGIAVAEESRVVYTNGGRSGYHAQRVRIEEATTMAVYPKRNNVQVVVSVADQQIGSITGARGRSGYSHAFRAME